MDWIRCERGRASVLANLDSLGDAAGARGFREALERLGQEAEAAVAEARGA